MAGADRGGGSAALAELIDTYGAGPVDHDLATLGIDLVEVIDGRFSAARALWRLDQLGEGSAIAAADAGGPQHRPWTLNNVLAAATVNALRDANWQRSGGRGKRTPPIEPPSPTRKVAGHGNPPRRRPRGALANRAARGVAARAAQQKTALPSSSITRGGLGVPTQD